MSIQQRIAAQKQGDIWPETGDFLIEDSTEVVETGFPIGSRIVFKRIAEPEGMIGYEFAPFVAPA